MRRVLSGVLLLLSLCSASDVLADCVYGGRIYPTGARVGNLTCQPNGSWR
jgi:hypothetical protein